MQDYQATHSPTIVEKAIMYHVAELTYVLCELLEAPSDADKPVYVYVVAWQQAHTQTNC